MANEAQHTKHAQRENCSIAKVEASLEHACHSAQVLDAIHYVCCYATYFVLTIK